MICVEELKTERLELKKITHSDLDDYAEWKGQEDYHAFLPSKAKSKEDYKNSIANIVKGYENKEKPTLLWGIFLNNKLIGSVSIENWDIVNKWCEIGWGINPKFQKQGLAYEAVKCLIDYIFTNIKMNKITATIWDGNEASKNLAIKLGFVQEGIEKKARIKDDKIIDVYCYRLLNEEWEINKKSN